jgi:hypothetical protein
MIVLPAAPLVDVQSPGISNDIPLELPVTFENLPGSFCRDHFVRFARDVVLQRFSQCIDNAQLHLRRRFSRERNRQYFLWVVNYGEELQISLDEQLGLPGPGRGLHDERPADVECMFTRTDVALNELFIKRHGEFP